MSTSASPEPGPAMVCLEAMYNDITRLLGDTDTTDMVVKCGENGMIRVHSLVMMARSPVFYSMLTTDMVEKREKEVNITDWEVEVVEQMINYMYTATVSPKFSRLAELLALADKYCIAPLVTLCSNQLALNITSNTALELGLFGETHSAEELLEKSAWFISQHLDCLQEGWVDRARTSPRLTTTILQHVREGRDKQIVVDRFGVTVRGTYGIIGKRDAIQFRVESDSISSPVFLSGLGLYGTTQEDKIEIGVSILQGKTTLTHFTSKWECDGSKSTHRVMFPHPVSIQPNVMYTIMQEVVGSGFIYQGQEGASKVDFAFPPSSHIIGKVVFFNSPLSTNNTDIMRGAIPRLVFKTHM